MNQKEYIEALKTKEYLQDIKGCLICFNIQSYEDLINERGKYARYALSQLITNVMSLKTMLTFDFALSKYLMKNRKLPLYNYKDMIDFIVIWKFIDEDLDECIGKVDALIAEYKEGDSN